MCGYHQVINPGASLKASLKRLRGNEDQANPSRHSVDAVRDVAYVGSSNDSDLTMIIDLCTMTMLTHEGIERLESRRDVD